MKFLCPVIEIVLEWKRSSNYYDRVQFRIPSRKGFASYLSCCGTVLVHSSHIELLLHVTRLHFTDGARNNDPNIFFMSY